MSRKLKKVENPVKSDRPDAEKLLARLVEDFPPEKVSEYLNKLLNATVPMKHGERPDIHAITAALKFIFGYRIGEPVKRIAMADVTERETDDAVMSRIAASPAAQRALAATLADLPGGREILETAAKAAGRTMEAVEVQ